MNNVVRKPIVFAIAGILLLTFCLAPPAQAAVVLLVPAVGFAIWGLITGIGLIAAGVDTAEDKQHALKEQRNETVKQHTPGGESNVLSMDMDYQPNPK